MFLRSTSNSVIAEVEGVPRLYVNSILIADNVILATSLMTRARGLLFYPELRDSQALVLHPCKQVHMFFMTFPLDVLFCNASGAIVKVERSLKPWHISSYNSQSSFVVELRSGTVNSKQLAVGDQVHFRTQSQ